MKEANLKIETIRTSDLVPYAGNAKEHPAEQVEQIASSIRETLELLVAKAKLSRTAYGRSLEGRVCRDCGRTFDATFRNQSRCRPCIDARRSDG